ncbi:MAG: DUF3090 family protein [Chloroflexi bacterium]|nr:DUF3090 family protein [Chloroflexota bacterium]
MANGAEHDLGVAEVLEAEAIGPPGQRRFRLRVTAGDKTASIWCEKTQVSALSEAVQQVLARHRSSGAIRRPDARPLEPFPDRPTHEFLAGRIALGYDEEADLITLFATDVEQGGVNPQPTVRVDINRQAARLFTAQAEETVAGGRPTCALCKEPLEGAEHLCPRTNGHAEDALAEIGPPEL